MLPQFSTKHLNSLVSKFRSLSTGKVIQVTQEHVYTVDEIVELLDELDVTGFVAPFDWKAWSQQQPVDWHTNPSLLANADLDTMRRFMTAHLRIERIQHGHIDDLFRSGYMNKFFDRLDELA